MNHRRTGPDGTSWGAGKAGPPRTPVPARCMRWTMSMAVLMFALTMASAGPGALGVSASPTAVEDRPDSGSIVLSVADAWALAEANHPDIVEAQQELASLARDVRRQEAVYAPSVTVSGRGLSVRISPDGAVGDVDPGAALSAGLKLPSGLSLSATLSTTTEGLSSAGENALRGTLSMSYPLFRSPHLDSDALALRQAEMALVGAERALTQLRDQVRAEVWAAIHAEQTAAIRAKLARDAYADAEAEWDLDQQRVAAGIATESDLIGAQVDLLRAEQDRLVADRTWEARRRELARMLGLETDGSTYLFENAFTWTSMPSPGNEGDVAALAVDNSLVVWERRHAVETARLQLAAERERSGLSAQISGDYVSRGAATDDRRDGWTIGLDVSYPLVDGGQRRMSLESREEAYVRAKEALVRAKQDVRDAVHDLFVQLEDARRNVEIAHLELSRADLELAAVRRQSELPIPTTGAHDVAGAERAVVRAKLAWHEAVQQYQAHWLELQRMQGAVPWDELIGDRIDAAGAKAADVSDGDRRGADGEGHK